MKKEIDEHMKFVSAVNKNRQEHLEIDIENMNR
jgi:hypothetical protein